MIANGVAHSEDGIKLEEVCASTGDAKLLVRGAVAGAKQDAEHDPCCQTEIREHSYD